jgi:hypothetical protein
MQEALVIIVMPSASWDIWVILVENNTSALFVKNSANCGARTSCRVELRRNETSEQWGEEEECACGTFLLTHLSSDATPHLICWSISLLTFYVGLNLAPTYCLCGANNLGCMSHGLTHMGFEISRNFGKVYLEICQTLLLVYIPVFHHRLLSWTFS